MRCAQTVTTRLVAWPLCLAAPSLLFSGIAALVWRHRRFRVLGCIAALFGGLAVFLWRHRRFCLAASPLLCSWLHRSFVWRHRRYGIAAAIPDNDRVWLIRSLVSFARKCIPNVIDIVNSPPDTRRMPRRGLPRGDVDRWCRRVRDAMLRMDWVSRCSA